MKYLKTFEEINWNPFKKKEKKPGNDKHENTLLASLLLHYRPEIEDCLQDLIDIGIFEMTIRELAWFKRSRALVYKFQLNNPISEEEYLDYISEITGRVSEIGKSKTKGMSAYPDAIPEIKCYYDADYSRFLVESDQPEVIYYISFIFSFYELKTSWVNRILHPERYGTSDTDQDNYSGNLLLIAKS